MKDIVENRARLTMGQKVKLMGLAIKENGPLWSFCLGVYYFGSALADRAFATMDSIRRKKGVPGLNSPAINKVIWEAWDWSARGEEWTPSPEWKTSVIEKILRPQMKADGTILEIGPGGGRWTGELAEIAGRLIGVDISAECVRLCRERFAGNDKVEFHQTSGSELSAAGGGEIDSIWSFDVFVHINRAEVEAYAAEFARVLKRGGTGVIHHGTVGGAEGGWRSDLTTAEMNAALETNGLEIVRQFKTWTDGDTEHEAGLYDDAVTVFRKA